VRVAPGRQLTWLPPLRAVLLAALLLTGPSVSPLRAVEGDFPSVVKKVEAGTVMIEARNSKSTHFGSGFFLESSQVIVTAYHVVEGARRIRVAIPNTLHISDALLVSASPEWDVAILRAEWPVEIDLPGLRLSREREPLLTGTEVAYTGYGFGSDESLIKILSTYRGIISSRVPHGKSFFYHLSGLVNQGLSGCALYLPGSGEVVGIVTRQFGPSGLGLGFGGAVPSTVIRRLAETVSRAYP
jgi:serine protease Do